MSDTITDFIKQDLAARLRHGQAPQRLTLAALAQHYDVSFTPVRLAVEELITERVLIKQDNGRLAVHPSVEVRQAAEGFVPPTPPQDVFAVEAALTDEIVRLSLNSRPSYLREETTAEQLGIGRTVLRQILSRLAGHGLIEHLPRRGWRVRPYDDAEMRAYLEVREALELKALDLARPNLRQADLERMLHGNEPEPGSQAERLDNDLHQYLIDKSGNRYLQEFFARHGSYHSMLFNYAAPGANVVQAMARQHRAILRALLAKDWSQARKALVKHIRAQQPVVHRLLKTLASQPAEASSEL